MVIGNTLYRQTQCLNGPENVKRITSDMIV